MLALRGLRRAEQFVEEQQSAGADVRWDGWDIVFFRPSDIGRKSPQGAFRNGVWGFDNRVVVDSEGVWKVDFRNVRGTKKHTRR